MSDRDLLAALFREGIAAVDAEICVRRALERHDPGPARFRVLAVGKAASGMARGARLALGERILGGCVTTKRGHAQPVGGLSTCEAGHPLPDAQSVAAAQQALGVARSVTAGEHLLVLLSGGASALWAAPAAPLTLEHKRVTHEALLRSGVDIRGLNTVRKHLSQIKGGGLRRAAPLCPSLTLAISDVQDDPPAWIGSGPMSADSSTFDDALRVLRAADVVATVPAAVCRHLEAGAAGLLPETPKPGDRIFAGAEYRIVAGLQDALDALAKAGEATGMRVRQLGAVLYGEARTLAVRLAREAREARAQGVDLLIAGGEPTVRVRGSGRGGRAQELALAFALEIADALDVTALFAGSDGSDGPTDAAGGLVDASTSVRARGRGLDARAHLENNDAYTLLEASGDLFITGPTGTNVTDFALIRASSQRRLG